MFSHVRTHCDKVVLYRYHVLSVHKKTLVQYATEHEAFTGQANLIFLSGLVRIGNKNVILIYIYWGSK